MKIAEDRFDLTYCSNIHSGENWNEVNHNLKTYILPLKKNLSPDKPFGIGLRLSHTAAQELLISSALKDFKNWLDENQLYVITVNGFPYGEFHNQAVKAQVYAPDWSTVERRNYCLELVKIIAFLTPENGECGFSTSPLSYKPWLNSESAKVIFRQSSVYIAQIVQVMATIYETTGKLIHIDIEAEPDCLIETTEELINFYEKWLMPIAIGYLVTKMKIPTWQAEIYIRRHVQACYDICHSSVEFENPNKVFKLLHNANINIGKIQVSAALKCNHLTEETLRDLTQFTDEVYLHQVIEKNKNGKLKHFNDLPQAFDQDVSTVSELRTHFHVPIFLDHYQTLDSTQKDIIKALKLLQDNKATTHLEIETYTWGVLPSSLKLDIVSSIQREYEWVIKQFTDRVKSNNQHKNA